MKQSPVKWLIVLFVLVMSAILYQGTASTSLAFGPYQNRFSSPIPTPIVNPTAVPEVSKLTQLALNHIATRAHIPVEQLILDNEHRRDYSSLGRSFWAVTALDAISGYWYTVLIDLRNSEIIDDVNNIEQAERDAQRHKYGKLDPSLFERLQSLSLTDKVPVAIWIAGSPKQGPEEMYAALAAKYPRANEALQRSGKPFDVGDQKFGNTLEVEYAKMTEEETSALTQSLANSLQEQGDAVESLRGMPVITALMSKAGILRTASRIDVGAIYLIEGQLKPELNTAVPTDRAPTVWKRGFKGNGVNIGILETGKVDFTGPAGHNYLHQGEVRSCSLGEDWHKTMVASVAASYHDIYTGAAPEATVVDACIDDSLIEVVNGLSWATERADVINLSGSVADNGQMNFIDMAFDYWALVGNDTIVKAAGNNGITVTAPGMAWNIITVGAIDAKSDPDWANDIMWPLSSWKNFTGGDRKKPEVVAPGASIRAIELNNVVRPPESGTSLAAPQAAGLAALLINRNSSLSFWPEAVKAIIMASAVHNITGTNALSEQDGAGAIDAALADATAITGITDFNNTTPCNSPCWWAFGINSTNFPVGTYLNRSFTASRGEHIRVAISWWSNVNCPDQSNCSDQLDTNLNLRILRPDGSVITTSGSLDNNYEIVDFIASQTGQYTIGVYKYSANETLNSLGIAWVKDATYLPYLHNKDGWASELHIRNGGITQTVYINYFDVNGSNPYSYGQDTCNLFPGQECWFAVNDPIYTRIPPGTTGSAIVSGAEDITVIVQEKNGNGELNEYNGLAVSGGSGSLGWEQIGTTVYAPIVKNAYGNRSSYLFVANAGALGTTVSITYYNSNGIVSSTASKPLAANGSTKFDPPTNCALCSAVIASSNGQPLAVAIREQDVSTNNRSMHSAFSAGALSNFVPVVKKNYGSQTTSLTVQNVGSIDTTVTVWCYPPSGNPPCGQSVTVKAKATGVFVLNLSDGFLGSAVVSSTAAYNGNPAQPIATLIYESGSPAKLVSNAPLQGTVIAYAPEIYGNYPMNGWTWNSGLQVQNVGSSSATVTVVYYGANGGPPVATYSAPVGANLLKVFNVPSGNMPTNFAGSAVITSNQPIVATVNNSNSVISVDNKASYTASNR